MILSNKTYDILKLFAMVILPAMATLYIGLGQIWGWEGIEQVTASIVVVNTVLGSLIQLLGRSYSKDSSNFDGFLGSNSVDPDTGIPNLQMTITKDPNEILAGKTLRLKVGEVPPT